MRLRSLLFVPGDRPERFEKAAASGADAIILDLEDSVLAERKDFARDAVADWLHAERVIPAFVRINALSSGLTAPDLEKSVTAKPDGWVLPKAEGAASVKALLALTDEAGPPILPIGTETAASIFQLGSYGEVSAHLAGLTWGAEDLPAAIGASTAREPDGSYTSPYEVVRSLSLFGAHAAGVPAIDTVFPRIGEAEALAVYVSRARRDGFSGMLAIHPSQVAVINSGFTATPQELVHAVAVVEAFAASPAAGVVSLDGKMLDRPHLLQAQRILSQAAS